MEEHKDASVQLHLLVTQMKGEMLTVVETIRGDIRELRSELRSEDISLRVAVENVESNLKKLIVDSVNLNTATSGLQHALNLEKERNNGLEERIGELENWLKWVLRLVTGMVITGIVYIWTGGPTVGN